MSRLQYLIFLTLLSALMGCTKSKLDKYPLYSQSARSIGSGNISLIDERVEDLDFEDNDTVWYFDSTDFDPEFLEVLESRLNASRKLSRLNLTIRINEFVVVHDLTESRKKRDSYFLRTDSERAENLESLPFVTARLDAEIDGLGNMFAYSHRTITGELEDEFNKLMDAFVEEMESEILATIGDAKEKRVRIKELKQKIANKRIPEYQKVYYRKMLSELTDGRVEAAAAGFQTNVADSKERQKQIRVLQEKIADEFTPENQKVYYKNMLKELLESDE